MERLYLDTKLLIFYDLSLRKKSKKKVFPPARVRLFFVTRNGGNIGIFFSAYWLYYRTPDNLLPQLHFYDTDIICGLR